MEIWRGEDEVKALADSIIKEHRPELAGSVIVYIFKEKAGKSNDKVTIASTRKVSAKDNVVHAYGDKPDVDFVIEIGADAWNELSEIQKTAVMHHALMHCGLKDTEDGDVATQIIPHDVEEFAKVIEAHGYYMKDIQEFVATCFEKKEKEKGKEKEADAVKE